MKIVVVNNNQMDDVYMVHVGKEWVRVENLIVPDFCLVHLKEIKEQDVHRAFEDQNWERFICELICLEYLD